MEEQKIRVGEKCVTVMWDNKRVGISRYRSTVTSESQFGYLTHPQSTHTDSLAHSHTYECHAKLLAQEDALR